MSLSADTTNRLGVGLASFAAGNEVQAAIDANTARATVVTSENAYLKTDAGVKDLLAAAPATRVIQGVLTVTTAFATGDGSQPTVSIGEESGSASKFMATTRTASASAGATFSFAGTLTAGKKLQATLVAGTGTTETGAYTIDVIAAG